MIRVVLTVYILKFNSIEIYYMCKWQFWTCDLVRFASQSIISVKDVTKSGGLNLLTFPKGIISQFPFDVSKRLDICMFLMLLPDMFASYHLYSIWFGYEAFVYLYSNRVQFYLGSESGGNFVPNVFLYPQNCRPVNRCSIFFNFASICIYFE